MASKPSENDISRISDALERLSSAMRDLKDLDVLRSQKILSDFSEWLIARIYHGEIAYSRTQTGWDVMVDSERIQVKAHAKAESNPNRWSTITDPSKFDSLVLLILSSTYKVREFYKISSNELIQYLKPYKHGYKLNWDDIQAWNIPKEKIPNYDNLSILFE